MANKELRTTVVWSNTIESFTLFEVSDETVDDYKSVLVDGIKYEMLYYYTAPTRVISKQDWVLAELQYPMYNGYARSEKVLEYLADQYGFTFKVLRR